MCIEELASQVTWATQKPGNLSQRESKPPLRSLTNNSLRERPTKSRLKEDPGLGLTHLICLRVTLPQRTDLSLLLSEALIRDIKDTRFKAADNGVPSPDKYEVAKQAYNMSTKLSPNKGNKIPESRKSANHRPNWSLTGSQLKIDLRCNLRLVSMACLALT